MFKYLQIAIIALIVTACGEGRMSPQGGTITSVNAGSGATGGGSSGAVTLNVVATTGGGLTVTANDIGMTMCAAGQVPQMNGGGTAWTCAAAAIVSGTTNTIAKFTSSTAVGNSSVTDNGTTVAIGVALSVSGATTVGELRGTVISPSTTGTLNDWAPTGIATATVIDIAPTGGIDLTGITTGVLGRIVTIRNANGIGYTVVIYDESASSTAANRFDLAGDTYWTLKSGDSMTFVYTSANRWTSIGHNGRQFPGIWTSGDISMGGASITGSLNYTGTGTLSVDGNVTIGNAVGDAHTLTGSLIANGVTGSDGWVLTRVAGIPQWAAVTGESTIAGAGLTLTGTTVDVVGGTGLSVGANQIDLNLAGASCSAGSFMSALSSTGSGTCTAATSIVSGTTNTIAKFTSSTAVGNSSVTDTGSLVTVANPARVDIGTSGAVAAIAGSTLIIEGAAATNNYFSMLTDNGVNGGLLFNTPTGSADGYVLYDGTLRRLGLAAGGLQVFKITSALTQFDNNVTLGDTASSDTHVVNGQLLINGAAASTSVFTKDSSLNCNYSDAGNSTCYINKVGYNGGTTAYRTLTIENGNNTSIARFNGTTLLTEIFGAATVYGNATLGDANTDAHTVNGNLTIAQPASGNALTTSGTGSIQVGGNGTFNSYIYSSNVVYSYGTTGVFLGNSTIGFSYSTNGVATGRINATGYNEGTTQFRNLDIEDGKGADIATFDGSTKAVALAGALTVTGISSLDGNVTLGDDATDSISSKGTFGVAGTDATISSCGTSPSVSGEAQNFQLTVGTTTTTCAVAFNRTFSSAPFCTFSPINAAAAADIAGAGGGTGETPYITSTTTTVTLTFANNTEAGAVYNVWCPGRF